MMCRSAPLSRNDTKDLSAKTWRYWTTQGDERLDMLFGADCAVTGFSGNPSARTVELKR
ncbi:hypothetical protein PMI12_04035 [Variovorax sp. CF313]|nr:hypothetical protein PMI12_04035 [Variovorax sp. CF313]